MAKFTIIGDSCANIYERELPKSNKYDLHIAPLTLTVNGKDYVDNQDLDTRELVTAVNTYKGVPKTACPSPEAFYSLMEKSDNIICILLSSKLSGTYASCMTAANDIKEKYPNKKLFVMDTLSACMGLDFIITRCIELIETGEYTFDELTVKLEEVRRNTRVRFLLYDLGNLIKNGRLSKVAGAVLNTMKIKLVCGDDGAGEIKKYAMALGVRRGLGSLADLPHKDKLAPEKTIMIGHVYNEEDAGFIKSALVKHGYNNVSIRKMRGVSSIYAADKGIVIAY